MKRLLFGAVIALIVTGCATQTVKLSDAKEAPQDRIFFKSEQGSDTANITIIRDSGFLGSGCVANVFIDGDIAVGLRPYEKVSFQIKEGEHIFGVTLRSGGPCNFGVDLQEKDIKLKAGERKYYRIFSSVDGVPAIIPTTQVH